MAPEKCFGDTYQNVIVAFTENCQENHKGASGVGCGDGFWLDNCSKLPQTNEFPVTDLLSHSVSQLQMPGTRGLTESRQMGLRELALEQPLLGQDPGGWLKNHSSHPQQTTAESLSLS